MSAVELLKNFHITDYILTFFILSFIGWTVETLYCSLAAGKFINRGFLTGPLCPIYGTGALVFSVTLTRLSGHWYLVLIVGMLLADIVEYITSYLMEKLFHARWWDYSEEFLNIKGRICLKHTCYWGIAALVFIYAFQPLYLKLYLKLPLDVRYILLAAILIIFVLDLINAVKNAIDVRKFMAKLSAFSASVSARTSEIKARLADSRDTITEEIVSTVYNMSKQLEDLRNPQKQTERKNKRKEKIRKNRLYTSYANLRKSTDKKLNSAQNMISELNSMNTSDNEDAQED